MTEALRNDTAADILKNYQPSDFISGNTNKAEELDAFPALANHRNFVIYKF